MDSQTEYNKKSVFKTIIMYNFQDKMLIYFKTNYKKKSYKSE